MPAFHCDSCPFDSDNHTALAFHTSRHGFQPRRKTTRTVLCDDCEKTFSGKYILARHCVVYHGKNEDARQEIRATSAARSKANRALSQFACDGCACSHTFHRNALLRHLQRCTAARGLAMTRDPRAYPVCCDGCNLKFRKKETSFLHFLAIHADKSQDGWRALAGAVRDGLNKVRARRPKRLCDTCGAGFLAGVDLLVHFESHHRLGTRQKEERISAEIYRYAVFCDECIVPLRNKIYILRHLIHVHDFAL